MAESTIPRTLQDLTIVFTDGAASYTVSCEPGDFSVDIPREAVELFLDRGKIGTTPRIRLGDDAPMTFSFSAHELDWGDTTGAAHATLLDLGVRFAGAYVASVWTTTATNSGVFAVTMNVTQEGSDFGGSDLTMGFTFCTVRASRADGYPNTISITGTSHQLIPTLA